MINLRAHMDKKTLEKIKELLEEEKAKIEKDLGSFAVKDEEIAGNYKSEFPDFGDKEDENASEIATYTDNKSVEYSLEKSLRDIKTSLDRIKKGTYGVCKYCGKEIDEKRLIARPTSSACVACKEKLQGK